jgi:hypothetical protein
MKLMATLRVQKSRNESNGPYVLFDFAMTLKVSGIQTCGYSKTCGLFFTRCYIHAQLLTMALN